jgi:hypothetical protein
MTDAHRAYRWLFSAGLTVLLLSAGALVYYGVTLRNEALEATPHLDGEPGPLREVLAFPWSDFPSIPDVERAELSHLIPIDAPLRLADIRPWLTTPGDASLGAAEARRNQELQSALGIMRQIAQKRAETTESTTPDSSLSQAKEHLKAAERSGSHAILWLIAYDRAVLYRWQGNRQKAAKELKDAYGNLKSRLEGSPSEETLSAGTHVAYALGDSLIQAAVDEEHPDLVVVPEEAVNRLRDAVLLSVRLATVHPHGVAHPAEFFELEPTHLSTRALRNDLVAAYLVSPGYQRCTVPMTAESCAHLWERPLRLSQ